MLFRSIRKAWRSRGFGVHSPFAFRFITGVLRGSGRYYAYPALRQISVNRREYRDYTLLFRVVCDTAPDLVCISVGEERAEAIRAVVSAADSRIKVVEPAVGLISLSGSDRPLVYMEDDPVASVEVAKSVAASSGIVIMSKCSSRISREVEEAAGSAFIFTNGMMTLIVSRPDFSRQKFELYF